MYTGTTPRMLDQPWERGCAKHSAVKGGDDRENCGNIATNIGDGYGRCHGPAVLNLPL